MDTYATPCQPRRPCARGRGGTPRDGKLGVLGALVGADGFRRDYLYDPLLRPFSVKTSVPASPNGIDWAAQTFTEEYGYDHNYGRVKAMSYPSNEFAALDYDSRGNLLGETAVAADGTRGTVYRHVNALSVRGQVTDQKLGNGVQETADYDESTGMAKFLSASLGEPGPAGCAPAAVAASLIVRQAQLIREVWGPERLGDTGSLRVCMKNLRAKVESDPRRPRYLVTEAGLGYRLRAD